MSQITQILKKIKRMDITTRHLVEGLVAGKHHSVFKGQGLEFSELREYRSGDDIRAIDWKVTARFNRPYIKEFIEERDLQIYFVIDVSGSGSFGFGSASLMPAIHLARPAGQIHVTLFLFLLDYSPSGPFVPSQGYGM